MYAYDDRLPDDASHISELYDENVIIFISSEYTNPYHDIQLLPSYYINYLAMKYRYNYLSKLLQDISQYLYSLINASIGSQQLSIV